MSKPPKMMKRKCIKCSRVFNILARDYFLAATLWCAICHLEMDRRESAPD